MCGCGEQPTFRYCETERCLRDCTAGSASEDLHRVCPLCTQYSTSSTACNDHFNYCEDAAAALAGSSVEATTFQESIQDGDMQSSCPYSMGHGSLFV